ncbi:hypothetical protein AVEN_101634-1 [Araneus ventricosus]|uniref:Uncharacterized protein n=1 Tax=Araneus ventricosus TaxID=182803 RepID=A0A4Y2EZK7_ARAVE|nr:hypothetical protein AVEN_101634-1 [Araneus ventricosus]
MTRTTLELPLQTSAPHQLKSTLPKPHSVLVGESAHQSIMPRFASSQPPTIWHHPANNVSQYDFSQLSLMLSTHSHNLGQHFHKSSTSVTEHPLRPAMREFKTNQLQLSVLRLHLSSSHHPFLWRWKVVSSVQHSTSPPLQPIIP